MSRYKKQAQNRGSLQMQIVDDKRIFRDRNKARYESMYVQFNKLKTTCENYQKNMFDRSLKRKNITIHQNVRQNIEYKKSFEQGFKRSGSTSYQTMLRLWKQKRENLNIFHKSTKNSGLKLRKANQIQQKRQSNQKWRHGLKEIQKKRNIIFQQIQNHMPKFTQAKK